jgi:hypothetical protein
MIVIHKFITLPRFDNQYRKLSPEIKQQTKEAIQQLVQHSRPPFPRSLRFEKLSGYKNPNIYTIHITPNHSHKASFELRGDIAVFRQVGTHKELDRAP